MARAKTNKSLFRVEYQAWADAIARCTRPNHPQAKDYYARGITMDPAFMCPVTGFDAFLAAVGPKPDPSLTLDRVDNDKGYCKGNLAWTSRSVQVRNQRKRCATVLDLGWGMGTYTFVTEKGHRKVVHSPLVEAHGKKQTLYQWSKELGIARSTLKQRLAKGWAPDHALVSTLFKTKFVPPSA